MLARQLASAAPDGEAGRTLQQIMGALEEAKSAIGTSEVFEPSMQPDGTLLLELGPKGQFSLQAPHVKWREIVRERVSESE
tara:strand:+ start:1295 stop:1537 length:243 start_codon:yes stop_codon:yes gene_type:complete